MNLAADDSLQPIRYISHNTQLMLMATVTENIISIWEWQEPRCTSLIFVFSAYSPTLLLGTLWRKVRIFSVYNAPAISGVEENPVRITSLHWLRKYKGARAPLLVSFLYHSVK